MLSRYVIVFLVGFLAYPTGQWLFSYWLSRPHVPKWPKDYRRICACMDGHE